ncbi:HD domain-containing protein [Fluviispira sanaruensis]|uniref:Phosphohydrolase n=1 Tax=Fluviispira sanaruensis TaxID=2493639 RepID=A0A4P2VQY1_FLUSA|nr:HD domain-containing protein [Fluviispira sanaruensis]BBH54549.1 phosphohydrolase [Fluviispira sanaruensis]
MGLISGWKGYSIVDKNTSSLTFIGKIRDSLHDTIPFTEAEKIIIDRPEFQRLRRINQTAFTQYAFPGASHSRFEHSLGVMHVAGLVLNSIIANQRRMLSALNSAYQATPKHICENLWEYEKTNGSLSSTDKALNFLEQSVYLSQCLRFAALLHDCGHAPFSHSGERFMMSWKNFENNIDSLKLPDWLAKSLHKKIHKFKKQNVNFLELNIRHEVYTLLIIAKIFNFDSEFLTAEMGQDICAVLDLSVEPHPENDLAKSGLRNLLHEIVSGEVDADRMDYLLRDSRECGIVYGYFDLGRILDSVGFYLNTKTSQYHLAMRRSGVSAFEDYLRARWSMYQQVYFHKTVTACEAMLQHVNKQISGFTLPIQIDEYLKLDDHTFVPYLKEKYADKITDYLSNILNDLVYNRKLWKRVYEEFIPKTSYRTTPSLCPAIVGFLKEIGCPSEIIENSTNLTRFSPKGREESSKNNFKIIIKDVHSLRYLEPVENHSTLINRIDEEVVIRRIYISRFNESIENIQSDEIQKRISDKIINPDEN